MSSIVLATRLLVLCLVSLVGGTPVTMDDSASLKEGSQASSSASSSLLPSAGSQHKQYYYAPMFHAPEEEKRAFTYRSEGKRLPVFSFGLGKRGEEEAFRADDYLREEDGLRGDKRGQPFSFGLGKRAKPYTFGLGKRSSYDEATRFSPKYQNLMSNIYTQKLLENYLESKRASAGNFNFGLGKRDADMGSILRDYDMQMLKHSRDNRYGFGLGKRDGSVNPEEYYDEDDAAPISAQLV